MRSELSGNDRVVVSAHASGRIEQGRADGPSVPRSWRVFLVLVLLTGVVAVGKSGSVHAALKPALAVAGRLGGSSRSIEQRFGPSTGSDASGSAYATKYYYAITVAYSHGLATTITVSANPVGPDWGAAYVMQIARAFLPLDAQIAQATQVLPDGREALGCTSAALAAVLSVATWKRLTAHGSPGTCHGFISLDAGGEGYSLELGLGAA